MNESLNESLSIKSRQLLELARSNQRSRNKARQQWERLSAKLLARGQIRRIAISQACEILYAGWVIEMQAGRYEAAADLARTYLNHPKYNSDGLYTRISFRSMLARSLLYSGREDQALAVYRGLLRAETGKKRRKLALLTVRNDLYSYLQSRHDKTGTASQGILTLVASVVKGLGNEWNKEVASVSYRDVIKLLRATYGHSSASEKPTTKR